LNDLDAWFGEGPLGEGGIFSLELDLERGLEDNGDLLVTGKTGSLIVS